MDELNTLYKLCKNKKTFITREMLKQYANAQVLEELEKQLMKYRKEYYDGRCFADDIEQRIKELKEVKP